MDDEEFHESVARLTNDLGPRLTLVLVKRFRIELHAAQDLVQDVIAAILERRMFRGQDVANLEAYVTTVVINRAIDEYRRVQRLNSALQMVQTGTPDPSAEEQLITDERAEALRRAVYDLPQPYYAIFTLLLERATSLAEVARELNISVNGIYTQYRRGLELLRQKLGNA